MQVENVNSWDFRSNSRSFSDLLLRWAFRGALRGGAFAGVFGGSGSGWPKLRSGRCLDLLRAFARGAPLSLKMKVCFDSRYPWRYIGRLQTERARTDLSGSQYGEGQVCAWLARALTHAGLARGPCPARASPATGCALALAAGGCAEISALLLDMSLGGVRMSGMRKYPSGRAQATPTADPWRCTKKKKKNQIQP